MTLPSLNLNFEKRKSESTSNANNIVLNVITSPINSPRPRSLSPPPQTNRSPLSRPSSPPKSKIEKVKESVKRDASAGSLTSASGYKTPAFDEVEREFKDQLLSFTTDLLLHDIDLVKNIVERGNKVLYHKQQLKQLISILYLKKEDRKNYNDLIELDTEPVEACCWKQNPFYLRIRSIYVLNSVNFLNTPFAVNMATTFRICLDYCLSDKGDMI